MNKKILKNIQLIIIFLYLISILFIPNFSEQAKADTFSDQLACAILANESTLISSSYSDKSSGNQQAVILSSLGEDIFPSDGDTFVLLSTGIAGGVATSNGQDPGNERGTWFGPQYPYYYSQLDKAILTMELQVPIDMNYLYYTSQFFSTEGPEWIDSGYNDKFTVKATNDDGTIGTHILDVDENGGDLVLDAHDLDGTGFDLFAKEKGTTNPEDPDEVDWVSTTPDVIGSDASATTAVDRYFQVTPGDIITLEISIIDSGDNQLDSAAYIDNFKFWPEIKPSISASKTVKDINGNLPEPEDELTYTIDISNIGIADQPDNAGNEFEDILPSEVTFVEGSIDTDCTYSINDPVYNEVDHKITWNGEIRSMHTVRLSFNVVINQDIDDGDIISNHAMVNWDSSDDGIDENDKTENIYANITVITPPDILTEDFSDDQPKQTAQQSFQGETWFETSENRQISGNFEVANNYNYSAILHDDISSSHSFKTKIRSDTNKQYWNYSISKFNRQIEWWEIWFSCGDASESSDLYLDFKNNKSQEVAKIKFSYSYIDDTESPLNWYLKIYYWNGTWAPLYCNPMELYLRNDWYKLKIKENSEGNIDYFLNKSDEGVVASKTDTKLSASFSEMAQIEWYSTKNPVACPMFFWDELKMKLKEIE